MTTSDRINIVAKTGRFTQSLARACMDRLLRLGFFG
jgi:hypothetical protein